MSQRIGGPMISGRSIFSRGHPDASEISGVSVGPPGTSTFTVIGLPSSSFAHTADIDFERGLGGAVGQHAQHGEIARGVVDDASEAALAHQRQRRAR